MIDPNMKSLCLKDMHPVQVEALMEFVGMALNLAALTDDQEIVDETESAADELVRLLGGNGVTVVVETNH